MSFAINMSGRIADDIDRDDYPPAGWHLCECTDAGDDEEGNVQLEFTIKLPAAHAGKKLRQRLFNPELSDDADKAKKSADKAFKWAGRMGALTPEQIATQADVSPDWISCIGNDYVLECERTKSQSTGREYTGPKYLGVHSTRHWRIPSEVRQELGLPPGDPTPENEKPKGRRAAATRSGTQQHTGTSAAEKRGQVDVSDLM